MEDKENTCLILNNLHLPHSKIKKICKLTTPTSIVSSEAIKVLTIGAVTI